MLADYIRQLYSALDRKRPYVTYNHDADHVRIVVTAGFSMLRKRSVFFLIALILVYRLQESVRRYNVSDGVTLTRLSGQIESEKDDLTEGHSISVRS